MSAFLCSENHISLLAYVANDDPEQQGEVFTLLLAANLRSVKKRYPDHAAEYESTADTMKYSKESPTELVRAALRKAFYRGRMDGSVIHLVPDYVLQTQIIKACDCFDYQACETEDYRQSMAAEFVELIRRCAISKGGHTRGTKLYEAVLWEID